MTEPIPAGGLSGAELQHRAIRGSLWTAIHAITSVPLAFVANAVVARVLGPGSYGQLAFFTLTLGLLTLVTNFGVSEGVIQWGSAAEARGDRREADGLLRRSLGFHLIVQLPLLLIAVLILTAGEPLWIAAALALSVAVPAALGSGSLAISIENKTAAGAQMVMGTNVVVQVSLMISAVVTQTAAGVWATRSVISSCLVPFNLLLLAKARRRVALRPRLPRGFPPGFWRYALQTSFAGILALLVFSRSEIFLLQALASPVALGQFALAFGIAAQITAPVDALLGPLIPSVAGLMSSASEIATRALQRTLRFTTLFSGAVLAIVLPPLYFLLPYVYGDAFAAAALVFLPLAATSCLQSCFNPVTAFLNARRRSGLIVRANAIALALGVTVAVATIPFLGVWGAVISNGVGQVGVFLVLGRAEAREHGQPLSWLLLQIRALVGAAAVTGLAVGLPSLLVGDSVVAAPLAGVIGLVGYPISVRVLRAGLDEGDLAALTRALNPRLARIALRLNRPFG